MNVLLPLLPREHLWEHLVGEARAFPSARTPVSSERELGPGEGGRGPRSRVTQVGSREDVFENICDPWHRVQVHRREHPINTPVLPSSFQPCKVSDLQPLLSCQRAKNGKYLVEP